MEPPQPIDAADDPARTMLHDLEHRLRAGQGWVCIERLEAWLATTAADHPARLDASLLLARVRASFTSGSELAFEAAHAAEALAAAEGRTSAQAYASAMMASSYHALGMHREASAQALKALALARQTGDCGAEAAALLQASRGPMDEGDHAEAFRLLVDAFACARAGEDEESEFWALNNVAHLLGVQAMALAGGADPVATSAKVDELVAVVEMSLAVARRTGHRLHEAYATSNLVDAFMVEGKLLRARELITAYAEIARDIGHPRLLAYATLDEVRILRLEGRADAAIAALGRAEHQDWIRQNDDLAIATSFALYELCKAAGDFAAALHHHEEYASRQASRLRATNEAQQRVRLARIDLDMARASAQRAQVEAEAQRRLAAQLARERDAAWLASRLDPLTGIGNRRAADEELEIRLAEARVEADELAVAVLDVDHFKRVNDSFGHGGGDEVLVGLARHLQATLREGDRAFRLGGEEFLLLLSAASPRAGVEACERIRASVEGAAWSTPGLGVTVSIGVTRATAGDTTLTVIGRADAALYKAKAAGRNRVESA